MYSTVVCRILWFVLARRLFVAAHVVGDPHAELLIVPFPWSEDSVLEGELLTLNELTFVSTLSSSAATGTHSSNPPLPAKNVAQGWGRFVMKPYIFNRKNLPGRRGNRITRCSNCSVSNKRQTRRQDRSTCSLVRSLESIELLEGLLAWHQVHLGYPSRSNSSKRTRGTKTLTCPKLRTRNFKLEQEKPLLFSGDPSLLLPNYFVLASENSNN